MVCPVCLHEGVQFVTTPGTAFARVECPMCIAFLVTMGEIRNHLGYLTPGERAVLSAQLREAARSGELPELAGGDSGRVMLRRPQPSLKLVKHQHHRRARR